MSFMFLTSAAGFGFVVGSQRIDWWVKVCVVIMVIVLCGIGRRFGTLQKIQVTRSACVIAALIFICTCIRGYVGSYPARSSIGTMKVTQTLEGFVTTLPKKGERVTSALVQVCVVNSNTIPCEKIRVEFRPYDSIHFRDRVVLKGTVFRPPDIRGEGGRVFDYRAYLALDDVSRIMRYPKVSVIGIEEGLDMYLLERLFLVRIFFVDTINSLFPHPYGALVAGLLVGEKSSLGKDTEELLRAAGIIHIVVLSGFNVTLICQFIFLILFFLPRTYRYVLSMIGAGVFCLFAGTSATVVRATCMTLIMLLGTFTYRSYAIGRALSIAACVMVFHDPRILSDDPSFQLSFLASVGLVTVSRLLEKRFEKIIQHIPETASLRETILSTISTQCTVLPYLVYRMGEVSLVSLPVNILVLPAVPFAMLFGFISFIGHVLYGKLLALPFVFLTDTVLRYVLFIAQLFTKIPGAVSSVPGIHLIFVLISYFVVAVVCVLHKEAAQPLVFFRSISGEGSSKVSFNDRPV